MIVEIALGIVLAVFVLGFLPIVVAAGVAAVVLTFVGVVVVLIVIAFLYDPYASVVFVLLLLPIAVVQWRDRKMLKNMRKSLGYEDNSRSRN